MAIKIIIGMTYNNAVCVDVLNIFLPVYFMANKNKFTGMVRNPTACQTNQKYFNCKETDNSSIAYPNDQIKDENMNAMNSLRPVADFALTLMKMKSDIADETNKPITMGVNCIPMILQCPF